MAIAYGSIYVASVAFGARDAQTVKAFHEAESYEGTSLIIAYSPCDEHGYDITAGLEHQKIAVESGYWPLYRYDPRRIGTDKSPMQLDVKAPSMPLSEYLCKENRFAVVARQNPERYKMLEAAAEADLRRRRAIYEKLAELSLPEEEAKRVIEEDSKKVIEAVAS